MGRAKRWRARSTVIIERYLCREVLRTCVAVLAVLVLVYGADRLTRYLSDAAAGAVAPDLVVQILALKLAEKLPVLLPLGLYLAVLLSLGRLYRDSEIVAFGAGGSDCGGSREACSGWWRDSRLWARCCLCSSLRAWRRCAAR